MQNELLLNAYRMLVGAGETPVNKTYKRSAIMEFTFWHWAISKEAKKKKFYGEIIKLGTENDNC